MLDTGIADRLRAAGLTVVEVAGWQTRSAGSFSPGGSVNHHTAGPASGATPSLDTVINGRSDLPGPLCNVLQSREPGEGNDKAYVVAAGRANHAGSGGWQGLSGNSSVYGLEIEHTGVDPLPDHRQRTAARIHAAMWTGPASMVCQHREWAPSRKIDAAENVDPDRFRQWVDDAQKGRTDINGGFLMALTEDQQNTVFAGSLASLQVQEEVVGTTDANGKTRQDRMVDLANQTLSVCQSIQRTVDQLNTEGPSLEEVTYQVADLGRRVERLEKRLGKRYSDPD